MQKDYHSRERSEFSFPFLLLNLFLIFEYARPQTWVPALGSLHIPMFIQILLFFCLVIRGNLFNIRNIQSKLLLAFVALMAIHIPIAVNNYAAYQTTRAMVLSLVIFLSIVTFLDSFQKIHSFFALWILINTICALIGITEKGLIIGAGFLDDENDFALVATMTLPFAYFMFLKTGSFKKKVFYLFAAGLFVVANITSFSRGGFVALVAVLIYCWYKTPKKVLATLVMAIILGVFAYTGSDKYWNEIKSIREAHKGGDTGEARLYYWRIAGRMFFDHPIIGVGPGNFGWNIQAYEPPEGFAGRSHASAVAHSIYFTLVPELGLIGLLLFAGLLYHTVKDKRWVLNLEKSLKAFTSSDSAEQEPDYTFLVNEVRKSKFIILSIHGGLIGYLVSGIFLSVLYYPHFWLLTAISVSIRNVIQAKPGTSPHEILGSLQNHH